MKRRGLSVFLITIFAILLFTNCHCQKKTVTPDPVEQKILRQTASAPALVYKTRKDYAQYVPVMMNAEKTQIVSYPDPTDVFFRGKPAYPTPLRGGFLLDNRGIGPNVAFLNYTYNDYSRLKNAPTMEQLMNNLLDKNPLLEMWNCGARASFKNEVTELNALIEKGFSGCHQLVKENKVFLTR